MYRKKYIIIKARGVKLNLTATQTACTIASSGINYENDGGLGWSWENFRAGVKSSVVNGALSYGMGSFGVGGDGRLGAGLRAGITSFANSTLDFNEDGWKIGIRNDNNWGDRFMGAAASGAAAYATEKIMGLAKVSGDNEGPDRKNFTGGITTSEYASHLISNTVNAGIMSAYNMKRYGMSWSEASNVTGFYSGMNYSVSELGGFAGTALMDYGKEAVKKREINKAHMTCPRKVNHF